MARFTISARGPAIPSPIERHADTASGAEQELHNLQRMVGKYGAVVTYQEGRGNITKVKLASLARAEKKGGLAS